MPSVSGFCAPTSVSCRALRVPCALWQGRPGFPGTSLPPFPVGWRVVVVRHGLGLHSWHGLGNIKAVVSGLGRLH